MQMGHMCNSSLLRPRVEDCVDKGFLKAVQVEVLTRFILLVDFYA